MASSEFYKTIKICFAQAFIKEKGSNFVSIALPGENEGEIKMLP